MCGIKKSLFSAVEGEIFFNDKKKRILHEKFTN